MKTIERMAMRARPLFVALSVCAGATSSFWMYGTMRTGCETVGFSVRASLFGVLFAVILPFLVIAPLVLLAVRKPFAPILLILGSLSAGSALSEALLLRDEQRFVSEVATKQVMYSRPRGWPNGCASLIFVPEMGIHATD